MKYLLKHPRHHRVRSHAILTTISFFALVFTVSLHPMAQDLSYHSFAGDGSIFLGVPNAINVLSNLPFLFVGLWGLFQLLRAKKKIRESQSLLGYSLGVLLTSFGSAYYHAHPNNVTLFWDRLPMTFAFMSLMGAAFEYRISEKLGRRLLPIFLLAGVISVLYWNHTEALGAGDLRPYIFVQFCSVILFPLIIWRYPKKGAPQALVVIGFLLYLLAKAFELIDGRMHALTGFLAGHPLKHLFAAGATYSIGKFLLLDSVRGPERRVSAAA